MLIRHPISILFSVKVHMTLCHGTLYFENDLINSHSRSLVKTLSLLFLLIHLVCADNLGLALALAIALALALALASVGAHLNINTC